MLLPPYNVSKDGDGGTLTGLCVGHEGVYVSCTYGPPRIMCLPRQVVGAQSP